MFEMFPMNPMYVKQLMTPLPTLTAAMSNFTLQNHPPHYAKFNRQYFYLTTCNQPYVPLFKIPHLRVVEAYHSGPRFELKLLFWAKVCVFMVKGEGDY